MAKTNRKQICSGAAIRRPVPRGVRVGFAATVMFAWLAVGGQDGCASHSGPSGPNADYVLPTPVIVVATRENVLFEADIPAAAAGASKADVTRVGNDPNRFRVVIPVSGKDLPIQQNENFCWAACTQTLLSQDGKTIDQQMVADQYVPDRNNQSATVGVVIRALNPELEPEVEAKGAVPIDVFPTTSDQMLTELMAGHLCMAGLVKDSNGIGHACVVCGATFAKLTPSTARVQAQASGMGPHAIEAMQTAARPTYGIYEVELIDPDGGIRKTMSGQVFHDQVGFIIDQPYAYDMLKEALASDGKSSSHSLLVQDAHSSYRSWSSSGPGHSESHVECSTHS